MIAPRCLDVAARLTPEMVLETCQQALEQLRRAITLRELTDGICKPFHFILPQSCLTIWLWDGEKRRSYKLVHHSWTPGHGSYPALLDSNHPISKLLAVDKDIDNRTIVRQSRSLGPQACASSAKVAHFRITTTGGLRLLITACVSNDVAAIAPEAARLLKAMLRLMAQAAVHALEHIQLQAERDVLSGISTLTNQSSYRNEFLKNVARTIQYALGAAGCSIFLFNKTCDSLVLGGTTGIYDPKTGRPIDSVSYRRGEGLTGWIWQTQRSVRLFDAKDPRERLEVDPTGNLQIGTKSAETPADNGPRPFLGMPIFHGETNNPQASFVGVIRLHGKIDGLCFLPYDEKLLHAVATAIAPAILHWNAMAELQKAHEIKDSLFDIIESCFVKSELKDILHKIVKEAMRIFDADSGCILLKAADKDRLIVETFEGERGRRPEVMEFEFEHGLCGHCANTRQTLLVPDVSSDPYYYQDKSLTGVCSEACTPILWEDKLLGVLNLDSMHRSYFQPENQYQKHALEILAKQAALAIHRTRMAQERETLHEWLIRTTEHLTTSAVASGIAHELKNGLTVIAGNVSNLHSGRHVNTAEILQTLKQRTDHLFTLAKRLLELTKVGDANPQLHYLNDVVSGSYVLLEELIKSKKMTPKLVLSPELSRPSAGKGHQVEIDDGQITQVLTNLVLNAIDASGKGKPIEISTRNESSKLVSFSVRDYGKGIPVDIRGRIFEMFFTTKKGGFGVGLHVANELVRRNGGRMEFDSKPGAGTCFTVYLPKHQNRR